jgi:hypothetical protein
MDYHVVHVGHVRHAIFGKALIVKGLFTLRSRSFGVDPSLIVTCSMASSVTYMAVRP